MKIGRAVTIIGCLVVILVASVMANKQTDQNKDVVIHDRAKLYLTVNEHTLLVEAVNTRESITLGLSGRETIGADGMLFILPEDQIARFWMRDMKFDLDIVWIHKGSVIGFTENVPRPSIETNLENLPTYSSNSLVDMVLELPAGAVKKYNIVAGNSIDLDYLP